MRIDVLGVGFDNLTMDEAVAEAFSLLDAPGAHYVVTPNPEIVEICRTDAQANAAINGADLVLPDGIGVIYGAKMLGTPLKEKTPGVDFATGLMEKMARSGKTLFLLGAKPGTAELAADKLQRQFPGLSIVGTQDGYFKDDAPVVEAIRKSAANVVFVCLGAPKQEFWIQKNGAATGAQLLCGLGGSIDVFAGTARRAPAIFCRFGFEWFYRLLKQPSRLGRMMKLPLFLVHVQGARGKSGRK